MMKRIVVATDGSESAEIGVRYAVALAKRYGARLEGIFVIDVKLLEGPFLRDLSASLGTAPYVNYQGNITMILEERGKAALKSFSDRCEAAGVPCATKIATGIVPRAIVDNSDLADLIVMGRGGEHSQWLEGLVGSTTEAVVRRATQPVLVTGHDTPGDKRFMVGYDGTPHARRALKAAAMIGEVWKLPFHVLTVGGAEAEGVLAEAQEYLKDRDVSAEFVRREGDPGETLIQYARECEADLLVMGAYGHSKVRELVLGSTTTFALNQAPCPVLLSR